MADGHYGTFEMSPAGPFEAGATATIVFTYTVGDKGLRRGGRLRICTPNMGWGEPLVLTSNFPDELVHGQARSHNPWKPINTTFRVDSKTAAWVKLWSEERWVLPQVLGKNKCREPGWEWIGHARQWRWWINADVEEADFAPGDRIVITYGDTEHEPCGVRVQPWPEDPTRPFVCVVDVDGSGELREAGGSPCQVSVVAGPPERTVAVLPSVLGVGEPVTVRASVLDRNLTHPRQRYDGVMTFATVDDRIHLPQHDAAQEGDSRALDGVRPVLAGITAIEVKTPTGTARTNPALVLAGKAENLYWGDLHAQSMYHQWSSEEGRGDSTRTPAELYQYARECSFLDFVALTNGACPSPENPGWEATQQAAIDFYTPHRFVTFKGWECGMGVQGDRCLIYREADVEPNFRIPRASDRDPTFAHALLRFCRESKYRIITSNHSFMKYLDWSVFDPEIDRIIEVYSCWGAYESRADNPLNSKRRPKNQSGMYALSLGYTPGFVAAGDSHLGYPGRSIMCGDPYRCQNWKAGLAAVYAPELTREAVWDALHARHCYGTTGARIVLRFHLNGERMGSRVEYDAADERLRVRTLRATVVGTDHIRRVDIIKNNALLHRVEPGCDRAEVTFEDRFDRAPSTRDWYYLRVFQSDGNAAWSSPIWVGPRGVTTPSPSCGE
ncbi:MAG: hypothetical protein A3K19_25460 [Lentisphaerae bacterium RIFOXYB12_FULL_65_16]|nr:MAG: hypothetical protein A3K18_15295 [Lentisphaerae bacterium RIFOXYA12_64_32]OGV84881.1 MAG: hypothetical protein A3K19_25460 [Lentisphaerae bacterium RIFOXYB12_FULL_65_16]